MERHRHNDDIFKKILENHPEFDMPQEDLEDMKLRLDSIDKPNQKSNFPLWLFSLLLIPMFLGFGYLMFQNQQLQRQVQSLQKEIKKVEVNSIEKRNITYVYDTIYHTINKETLVQNTVYSDYLPHTNEQNYSPHNKLNINDIGHLFQKETGVGYPNRLSANPIFTNGLLSDNLNLSYGRYLAQQQSSNDELNDPSSNENDFQKQVIDLSSIAPFTFFVENEKGNLELLNIDVAHRSFKKRRRNPLSYLSPKGFHLGLSASPFGLSTLSGVNSGGMTNYGLASEIVYNKNFRLGVGVQITQFGSEIKDPARIAMFPSDNPDDPNDFLKELYVTLNQIQIPITLKYLFHNRKKLTPFVSGGFAASRSFRQSFRTEFISTNLTEYSKTQNFTDGLFSIKNFRGAVGLEYDFNAHWAASAEGFYYHDFELNSGEYFLLRNLGLNIALKKKW